jgi:hypothetical protein
MVIPSVNGITATNIAVGDAVYLFADQRGDTRAIPPCIGAFQAPPVLQVSVTTLNLGTTTAGTAGAPQTCSISGSDLTGNVVITAPAGVELSANGIAYAEALTLTSSGGTLAKTTISLRISAPAKVGSISGTIADTSSGAIEEDVAVNTVAG